MTKNLELEVFRDERACETFLVGFQTEFLKNRLTDFELLENALHANDINTANQILHKWSGICMPYGFEALGRMADFLSEALVLEDWDGAERLSLLIRAYFQYKFEKLEVEQSSKG